MKLFPINRSFGVSKFIVGDEIGIRNYAIIIHIQVIENRNLKNVFLSFLSVSLKLAYLR